jgi:hypothetical protein
MPIRRPHRRRELARRLVAGAVLAAAVAGCKSTGKGDGGSGNTKSDPIFGRNIPKQDIPIPGKDGGYGADNRDPLLRNNQASRDGDRFEKEPYRPTAGTTPAALASKNRDDQASVPSLDDRPVGTPTGRSPAPFRPAADADGGGTLDQALDDLRRLGVKWSAPRRGTNGETVLECDLPLGPNGEGPFRHYEGVGSSDAAAARDALKQIKSEPNR